MSIKNIWIFSFLLIGIFFSCKKNKDENNGDATNDPRIRTMVINGLSTDFVVDDEEGLIYNSDSLPYGTNIKALVPTFTGYGVVLTYQVNKNGVWTTYSNTTALDFTSGLTIRAIAPQTEYTKDYQIDIRVHNYDVEAFTWNNPVPLPVNGDVISEKAIFKNGFYYFFYTNSSANSYVLTSTDGENWINAGQIMILNPDWTTLTAMSQSSLAVKAGDALYVCDLSTPSSFVRSEAQLPQGFVLETPLFALGTNFWIIAEQGGLRYLCSLAQDAMDYQQGRQLPSVFPVDKITTFVLSSGSTMIGYIFGGSDLNGNGTVWAVDINGSVVRLTGGQSGFPALTYPMPFTFDNTLYIVGGMLANGDYTRQCYASSNSGATWTANSHKTLPVEIGAMAAGSIFEYEPNRVILIGGKNQDGFLPMVRKGLLNQVILDEINNH